MLRVCADKFGLFACSFPFLSGSASALPFSLGTSCLSICGILLATSAKVLNTHCLKIRMDSTRGAGATAHPHAKKGSVRGGGAI